jgi:predicted alpha/beta hydrolase family esterase
MSTKYFIVPGFGNSGPEHWQTYFENSLPNCERILQKSWDKPICDDWVMAIHAAVMAHEPQNVILVSHSMGGIAIAIWTSRFAIKIKGALLVAPPDLENPYMDLSLDSFTPIPQTKLPFKSVVVASSQDHWATLDRSKEFAHNWGSQLVVLENAGHINTGAGYGPWNAGLEFLKTAFES